VANDSGRRPTVDEAVAYLRQLFTMKARRDCLNHWRKCCGEPFTASVEREFLRTWKPRRAGAGGRDGVRA
jgi:hypothetical protein